MEVEVEGTDKCDIISHLSSRYGSRKKGEKRTRRIKGVVVGRNARTASHVA